jgi:hypothetical protein
MQRVLDIMVPEEGDGRIQTTAPLLRAMIRRELGRIVRDELPVWDYVVNKTAKSEYKQGLPEHMVVCNRYNDRVRQGLMAPVGKANLAANKTDGGDRVVNFDLQHSGARVNYLVYYDPKSKNKKIGEHVEEPHWWLHHNSITPNPKKHFKIDRNYYLLRCAPSIVALLVYHVPDALHLFEAAAVDVDSQMKRSGDILDWYGSSSSTPSSSSSSSARSPNDRWTRNYKHLPINFMKTVVQKTAAKAKKAAKAKRAARREANPTQHGIMRFLTKK